MTFFDLNTKHENATIEVEKKERERANIHTHRVKFIVF